MRVEFLPAYSPDLNPIEQAFSIMKAYFCRNFPHFARSNTTGTEAADELEIRNLLFDMIYSITAEQAESFFRHSRYI
ncbi:hypothetical protein GY45DRAFT_1262073 [Cubamyces sp. BRFM 1775]|nr:hypothetical protein GY45DRAFT_1262073 [Cubamyces sp. BRFM 1775]